jgi:exosortase
MTTVPPPPLIDIKNTLQAHWWIIAALLLLAVPSFVDLGKQVWSTESGAHGPIVLIAGIWLLSRQIPELRARALPGSPVVVAGVLLLSLPLYVFGRAYDFISLEALGLYLTGLVFLYAMVGARAMLSNWFPLLYLAFILPPPGWLVDSVTAPLKEFASLAAFSILEPLGVPIVQEGVTLFVAQYQLLVEDACSGMNSLVGLIAISSLYIYLARNATWRYALVLLAFVIPIAIIANILRIIVLVLLTYFFGDGVAQGFLHVTAGLFLFATALILVFALDSVLAVVFRKFSKSPA